MNEEKLTPEEEFVTVELPRESVYSKLVARHISCAAVMMLNRPTLTVRPKSPWLVM